MAFRAIAHSRRLRSIAQATSLDLVMSPLTRDYAAHEKRFAVVNVKQCTIANLFSSMISGICFYIDLSAFRSSHKFEQHIDLYKPDERGDDTHS